MNRTTRIIIVAISVFLMFACVPTPKEEAITGKSTELLIETANQNDDTSSTGIVEYPDVPKHYSAELVSTVGRLSVSVDADINIPQTELPLVRIIPGDYSETIIQSFAKALFGENPHYINPDSLEHLTKGYYEHHAEDLMDALEHWDEYGCLKYDLVYETRSDAQKALDVLIKKAASAPNTLPAYSPDFSYNSNNANEFTWAFTLDENNVLSRMDVSNTAGIVQLCYWRDADHSNINITPNEIDVTHQLSITESDALAIAKDIMTHVGLEDFVCVKQYGMDADSGSRDVVPCYMCIFTREIRGIPVTYTNNGTAAAQYDQAWRQERVFIEIDDNGVLMLLYESPFEILDFLTDRCSLLPFSKIQSVFENRITVVNNDVDFIEDKDCTERYIITEIRLGLIAIREEDKKTGLLVPAWDFLGYKETTDKNGNVYAEAYDLSYSFLTINAIDGSIINRDVGY
jgi:hypothetical protein